MNDYKKAKKIIGENIGKLLEAKGWTQEELARRMGLSLRSISAHIHVGGMEFDTLLKYTEVFNCKLDDLLDGLLDKKGEQEIDY